MDVGLNLAIAAGSATLARENDALPKWLPWLMTLLVVTLGTALIWHYNGRATRQRMSLNEVSRFLQRKVFDYYTELGRGGGKEKGWIYDWAELAVFVLAIFLSAFLAIAVLTK